MGLYCFVVIVVVAVCFFVVAGEFFFRFFSLVLFTIKCWSYEACARPNIKIRSYVKPYFYNTDRDLLLFVSKSRKTEMFISQIRYFSSSFLSLSVCLSFWLCLSLNVYRLHARLALTNQAQNNFNNKIKTVLPNVNHSRFHLRYGMVNPCIYYCRTRVHSLTS